MSIRYNDRFAEQRFFCIHAFGVFLASGGVQLRTEPALTNSVITLSAKRTHAANDAAVVTLREFVAGPENRVAVATMQRLTEQWSPVASPEEHNAGERNPAALPVPSPIVFYGPPGTGKSLLARDLFDCWKRDCTDENAVLLSAADFARQYAEAINKRNMAGWRRNLRTAGLLVLEDLSHLAAKTAAQAELLHTLDELAERPALVVVTSRVSPAELTDFLPGLQSRLQAGLCLPIALPQMEARRAILAACCAARRLSLGDGALRLLARSLALPAPELAGVLNNMQLAARTAGQPLDDLFVQNYLKQYCASRHPPLKTIATHTARHFALRVAELRSASRRRGVVVARDVAMYLARQLTRKSLKQIGEYFGGRDHTTVLHGCRKTESLMHSDAATLEAVTTLRQALAAGTRED